MVVIKTKCCGEVICQGHTIKGAILSAYRRGTSLRYANLEGANLIGLHLPQINFSYANLRYAKLNRTNLVGAYFCNTDLRDAHLQYANLRCANILGAKLDRANLSCSILRGALIDEHALEDANTREVNMSHVCFT